MNEQDKVHMHMFKNTPRLDTEKDFIQKVTDYGFDPRSEEFMKCYNFDPLFHQSIRAGLPLADIVLALSKRHRQDTSRIIDLQMRSTVPLIRCTNDAEEHREVTVPDASNAEQGGAAV
jgi:hypothetical protein